MWKLIKSLRFLFTKNYLKIAHFNKFEFRQLKMQKHSLAGLKKDLSKAWINILRKQLQYKKLCRNMEQKKTTIKSIFNILFKEIKQTNFIIELSYIIIIQIIYIQNGFYFWLQKQELQNMVTECTKFFVRKANIQPQTAFQEFVQCYFKGETVLLRPYQQICNSKMNRIVFVINFNKKTQIFESFEDKSGFDYYQLTKLLCSDFPREIVVNSLLLYANLDEDILFKKTFTLLQFCKALLFELLFENLLQELSQKLNSNGIIDSILPILKKYYPSNDEYLYLPNPAAVFECLMKFSNEKNKACLHPILPFTVEMFSSLYLNGGVLEFNSFKQQLFKNAKVDFQLTKLINLIENSNQRILDSQRLDEDEIKKKKQK
ncbi:unnamed protein product [Paramecium sonneborni]|uniref:Uncharacterized protein n=1 Tax=Paramecium sonneborni TaxID=65129 RepID=A0A8S1JVC4_9CILI|nr:unnamed protein product [Paramecium sonneborni]